MEENRALLRQFLRSVAPLLEPGAGCVLVLLHICVLDGVPNDQYVSWGVDSVASEAGWGRVAAVPFQPQSGLLRLYQPRDVVGKPFAPDAALFHVLRPLP